jgi:hypothetical protein
VPEDGPARVSVVIVSRVGGEPLLDCIESFTRLADDRVEIIVSECAGIGTASAIHQRFPSVVVQHASGRPSVPALRRSGLLAARGDIIAMTTGRCRADENWLRALRRAHANGAAAVGGAVEYGGGGRLADRAVFFCEYGRYMRPLDAGRSTDLPGQNVSYSREALAAIRDLVESATWEPLWHWRLAERGFELVRDPSRVVSLTRAFTFRAFLAERYHYSRAFAGQRVTSRSWLIRLAFAAGTVLLPGVVLARVLREMAGKRGRRAEWVDTLPPIALFTIPWAVGEFVGYLAGPGDSAARID